MCNRALTLSLSAACLLSTTGFGYATCLDTEFRLEKDNTAKNIKTILDFGRCVKAEQRERVGKWFCYFDKMVGIQKDDQQRVTSGRINPSVEKFFLTIKEINDDKKELLCEGGVYGLNYNLSGFYGNACLANYEIEFSPKMGFFNSSTDTYHFHSADTNFTLFGTRQFVLFQLEQGNSYVSKGACEKVS